MTTKTPKIIAPLGNTEIHVPNVSAGTITLIRTPQHVQAAIYSAQQQLFVRDPGQFQVCLVLQIDDQPRDEDVVRRSLEDVVLLLRLYKLGNIYYNFILQDHDGWLEDPTPQNSASLRSSSVFFFKGWSHPGLESSYVLNQGDAAAAIAFVDDHRLKPILRTSAFTSFFRGYHEPYADDRLLRNAVGLENLFVNDTKEQSNVTYKFVDRGSFLLQLAEPHPGGAERYADSLKKIYRARSTLVHANEKGLDWADSGTIGLLVDSDRYLRSALRLVLKDESLAQSTEIDRRKRARYGAE